MWVEGLPPLRAGRLLTAQSAGVSWPESGTPQMGAAGGLAVVQRLELCSGKWGPRVGQLQVPRRGVSEGGWSEEGEAGWAASAVSRGCPRTHRPWTAGEESVAGWGGRALASASGPQRELAPRLTEGVAEVVRLQVTVPGCRTQRGQALQVPGPGPLPGRAS